MNKTFQDSFDEAVTKCSQTVNLNVMNPESIVEQGRATIEHLKELLLDRKLEDDDAAPLQAEYSTLFWLGIIGLYLTHTEKPHGEIVRELKTLMVNKQRDYGKSNILGFRHIGLMVRVSDKIERLGNLIEARREGVNEPIEDTYRDLANYGLIGTMLCQGTFERPLGNENK